LAEQLAGEGIERVVVESTSEYWRPFVSLLEARGLVVWLVNGRDVKHLPGRPKTDKLDTVWVCKLTSGHAAASFVPPAQIRRLRDYTRLRADLTADRSRHKQRVEKLLEDALIKLSTVATDIFGVSGRAMIEALIAGQRDPKLLAEPARGRLRVTHAAQVIIAEVGLDMGQFPTRRPGVVGQAVTQDHPIRRHPPRRDHRHGQPYLKAALGEAATAAAKTDTFLGERYRRLVRRIGKGKALVAVARSILVIIWPCSPIPPHASTTSAPTTTPAASTATARPATWCTSSSRSATRSPSSPPPD
jgi:transposase